MNINHSFCSLPSSVVQDKNLSLEAKGLYHLIQSCMEEPEFYYDHFKSAVKAKCKESSDAFDSAWNELIKAGYLKKCSVSHGNDESFSLERLVIHIRME